MRLSEHFSLEELTFSQEASRKRWNNEPGHRQIQNLTALCTYVLEPIRRLAGAPIFVTSGYRSPQLNAAVGGSRTSQHMDGQAADIRCPALSQEELLQLVAGSELDWDQLIDEFGAWVHVSYVAASANRRQVLRARSVRGETLHIPLSAVDSGQLRRPA